MLSFCSCENSHTLDVYGGIHERPPISLKVEVFEKNSKSKMLIFLLRCGRYRERGTLAAAARRLSAARAAEDVT